MEPYRPWGKIFGTLVIAAGIMGLFVWKYFATMQDAGDNAFVHVPKIIKPLYDIFGEALYLIIGAIAAILFVVGGLSVLLKKDE